MENELKNNEVYKIEIEIDNLTKEQYESIWAQLVDISGQSGREITMKGGLADSSNENSGLNKPVVIKSVCDEPIFDRDGFCMRCGIYKTEHCSQTVL